MKPVNFKTDYLSWISHSLYFIAVQSMFGVLGVLLSINPVTAFYIGFTAASLVFYLREVRQEGHNEFWRWGKLDSILDFTIPMVVGYSIVSILQHIVK
jgi:hypothetical protein